MKTKAGMMNKDRWECTYEAMGPARVLHGHAQGEGQRVPTQPLLPQGSWPHASLRFLSVAAFAFTPANSFYIFTGNLETYTLYFAEFFLNGCFFISLCTLEALKSEQR